MRSPIYFVGIGGLISHTLKKNYVFYTRYLRNTGCIAGVGSGKLLSNGFGGGGGHGGKGGDGYYNGSVIEGGITYGNADLPCELGSGSGNISLPGSTAGGGIIGKFFDLVLMSASLFEFCPSSGK